MAKKAAARSRAPAHAPVDEQAESALQQPQSRLGPGVLAERIQYLFEHKRRPDGKRYSYREVLAAIETDGGPSMSIGYLSQLANGVRTNPMMDAIQGLARFFQVPLSYFDAHESTIETNERINLVDALRHAGVQNVAMKAAGLPPESIALIESMIDRVRQVEGLPPAEPASGQID